MKNELKEFMNEKFGNVRVITIDEKAMFVAKDIATILGYSNTNKAINDHCKKAIMTWGNDSLGRRQEFKVISKSDIYRLIVRSKLPSADEFESWIFDEVLPSIEKHGMYATDDLLNDPDLLIKMANELKNEREKSKKIEAEKERIRLEKELLEEITEQLHEELQKKDAEILEVLPIKEQYNDFLNSTGTTSMKDTAKLLHTGRNYLMEFLRDMKVLNQDNSPASAYTKNDYFTVKCYVVKTIDDKKYTVAIPRTTNKGKDFLYKYLRKHIDEYSKYDTGFKVRLLEVA